MATVTMSVFSMSAAALGKDIEVKDEWESVPAGDVITIIRLIFVI